jgi:hypothetical protein
VGTAYRPVPTLRGYLNHGNYGRAIKFINLAKDSHAEYQLQRIGYILDHIDVMDENNAEIIINALAQHVQENKPNYLPLASEISKIGYSRCKK